ncbi:MAG: fibrobacter succinogenes major paralogous domain-containing protein [Bacteroidetes bacterium]|nr:fibrobacter succinogenes major paralogous domain-containing protein [Bacteroidota bacterium]
MKKTLIIIGAAAVLVACSPTKKETPTQPVSIEQAINKQLTYGKAYDVDSNEYKTIAIGKQTWFAENLRTVKFNDGTAIANVTENAAWASNQEPAFAAFNNDVPVSAHGLLYNYKAIEGGNLCPEGWRVPTDEDWNTLADTLGGSEIAGTALKANNVWKEGETTNASGFSALPSGFRERDGRFHVMGQNALWWSQTPRIDKRNDLLDTHNGMYYSIDKNTNINHSHIARTVGLSVRCVKE